MCCNRPSWPILATLLFALAGANATVSYKHGHTLPHNHLCKQMGIDLRLLIMVASPLNNAAQRDAIRFSWGHYARSSHVAVAFVLGTPEPYKLDVLAAEDALYGDLIIGNSDDSYPIFKMVSMFDWMDAYCSNAPRLFATNDSVFTNVMGLLKLAEAPENVNAKLTVWGDFVSSSHDVRGGDVYLFTNDTIGKLLPAASEMTSQHDVLLSVDKYRDITRQHVPDFINNLQQSCNIKLHVACRIFFHYQHYELWQTVLESHNGTRSFYFTKGANVVVGSSKSFCPMKPVINTGISILSLLFLLFMYFLKF